jgi:GntR family transcriptional regulator, transcriptional repressor for pyruvate dehydrogenase complex
VPARRAPAKKPPARPEPDAQPREPEPGVAEVATPPRRLKLSERLARQVAAEILRDRPAPGTILSDEKQMADRYGVARSTLREALRLLETWGLLSVKAGRTGGPLVTTPSPSDLGLHVGVVMQADNATLGDVLEAREVMDGLMARRAALFISDTQLEELAICLQSMRRAIAEPSTFEIHTSRFFEILVAASKNPALAVLSGSLRTVANRALKGMRYSEAWRGESVALRRSLLRALAAGDPAKAEKQALNFRSASRRYIESLDPTIFDRAIDIFRNGAE